ncbi:hypothetical protein E2C01_099954 [Portunus trituberculatus]|uniref:Uncharacterized protein n=1 Tax=Portunus trituberculatus TaxID=210409 RepID=A0A5B7KI59_PORTR|nr:hypothetical protein [Portunus trituberculatus]
MDSVIPLLMARVTPLYSSPLFRLPFPCLLQLSPITFSLRSLPPSLPQACGQTAVAWGKVEAGGRTLGLCRPPWKRHELPPGSVWRNMSHYNFTAQSGGVYSDLQ